MKVLWRSDLGQGKHDPLEITHLVTKSGSQISADLVVPLDPVQAPALSQYRDDGQYVPVKWYQDARDEAAGLHEIIDAQLAEIDRLAKLVQDDDDEPA